MDNQPQGSPKQELAERLKSASNVLVTVSRNPSVDQLAALVGLGLFLNKQGKHTAAVFSGQVPSTLEFLQPEETLEKTTDSLRDFIISLDKTKADKLRYKVEDDVVRIFITPYKTSISQDDLDFSQGDFNVDLVITLGVSQQEDLDQAITAHGRILHDATVASITTSMEAGLGSINWHDAQASSLSELVTELTQMLDPNLLDGQIATALLTGIVAETERFSNDKTSPQTMSASAALMSAGANQQLVASQLAQPPAEQSSQPADDANEPDSDQPASDDGAIKIDHKDDEPETDSSDTGQPFVLPPPADTTEVSEPETELQSGEAVPEHPRPLTEPPSLGGTLTANSTAEALDPSTDPFSLPASEPPKLMDHKEFEMPVAERPEAEQPVEETAPIDKPAEPVAEQPQPAMTPPPPAWTPPPVPQPQPPAQPPADEPGQAVTDEETPTLADIEQKVKTDESSGQPATEPTAELADAREEVTRALAGSDAAVDHPEPAQALNAQPLGDDLHPDTPLSLEEQIPGLKAPDEAHEQHQPEVKDPNAPPPVPPPFMPNQPGDTVPPQK